MTQRVLTIHEGELAYMRWTIRILAMSVILAGGLIVLLALKLDASKKETADIQEQVEELKAKLALHEIPLGQTQKTVDTVTNMIAKLGKKKELDAERLAILEVGFAAKYNFDLPTGLAVSYQESKWREDAVSVDYSSIGVKQINWKAWRPTFKDMTVIKLKNPAYNIDVGYSLLASHLKEYGSLHKALQRYRGSDKTEVNVQYADDVLKLSHAIRKHLDSQNI